MKAIEPDSPLPHGAPLPPRANIAAMAAALNQGEDMKPGPKEQQVRDLKAARIEAAAKAMAADGAPDAINRNKTMTPEEIEAAEKRAARVTTKAAERKVANPKEPTGRAVLPASVEPAGRAILADNKKRERAATKARLDALKESTKAPAKPAAAAQESSVTTKTTTAKKATPKTRKGSTKSAARRPVKSTTTRAASGKTKTQLIADMLRRPGGCTTAEVLKATGWPSVSMPQQAKLVGIKLIKKKDGKVTRYSAGS